MSSKPPELSEATNFCRVFEIPERFPEGFCFGGGKSVEFKMVDWFNPWPPDYDASDGLKDITIDEWRNEVSKFVGMKRYIKAGRRYLVITDFGLVILISIIAIWIGYSMLTTPAPVPLEELEEELAAEEAAENE